MRTYALFGLTIGLVVVGIIVYRAGVIYTRGTREAQHAVAPPEKARNLDCQLRIKKIQDAIQLYFIENGKYPEQLSDLNDIPGSETFCPITGQPYQYDYRTGNVFCPQHR
ncbi:MAG: hypothetical protein ABIL39_08825 [candidate division WOR-3 bacterium]